METIYLRYIGPNIIQPLTLVISYPFNFPVVAHNTRRKQGDKKKHRVGP